ncbi:DinB family protein [Deinococcus sp. MIMF12]|uniref:DinB family protein n=1 Tax=Deinococcus rhizophilus TaxID=3049544 RepID=A0ABT7JCN2_9DEIO|nr:DinB family protein [Deinococcus rhizophilus]MDL2342808.1 DinB family protein [Deinococcus rhizophilus]
MTTDDRRFPIGPIQDLPARDRAALEAVAARMEATGREWREAVSGLDAAGLARSYRPGGWTVAQLAHHAADAHVHGLNRLKYALTVEGYVIQPFAQEAWLTLADAALPVEEALALMDAANVRWAALLRGTDVAQFDRRVTHPQEGGQDLWRLVAKHDWHLRHHLAQARLALAD